MKSNATYRGYRKKSEFKHRLMDYAYSQTYMVKIYLYQWGKKYIYNKPTSIIFYSSSTLYIQAGVLS